MNRIEMRLLSVWLGENYMSLVKITGIGEEGVLTFLRDNYVSTNTKIPYDNLEAYAKYTGKLPDIKLAKLMGTTDITDIIHLF